MAARWAYTAVAQILKDLSLATGLLRRRLFRIYPYMYEPHQLEFLLQCIREVADVPGACVEVGCGYGATTAFLNKYLRHLGSSRPYFALDTFSGFVVEHLEHEIRVRGKDAGMRRIFANNRKRWVAESLEQAGISGVNLVECDAASYDFGDIGEIAFCLVDIDLYQPVSRVLPKVYEALSPGAVLVIDDCRAHARWDGSLVAYEEFIARRGLPREIVCDKLGVIRARA